MDLPDQKLPAGFLALPESVRRVIVEDGARIGELVAGHTVQILIGPPASAQGGAKVNHASGVHVLIDANHYLATAAHVIRKVADRVSHGERVISQIGNAIVPVLDRIVWWDEALDLAVVALEPKEVRAIPAKPWAPVSWPPAPPVEGEYVAFAGFPARYRVDGGPGQIDLNLVGGILRIESASDRRMTSVIYRDDLVLTKGPEIPPKYSELGGMSGGPVFRIENKVIELVAIIKEDSKEYDALFFAPLSGVTLGHPVRTKIL
jgi:hypothetical protein